MSISSFGGGSGFRSTIASHLRGLRVVPRPSRLGGLSFASRVPPVQLRAPEENANGCPMSMSYLAEITLPLVRVLRHFATLPAHQLAGQAANMEFWRSEVEHRRLIIRSYRDRFRRMRDAEQAYSREHGLGSPSVESSGDSPSNEMGSLALAGTGTQDSERQELLRELDAAFGVFWNRITQFQAGQLNGADPSANVTRPVAAEETPSI